MVFRRLWIDDERVPPKEWAIIPGVTDLDWAQTSVQAINLLRSAKESGQPYAVISFDHDLGYDWEYLDKHGEYDTTVPVVEWMIENDAWVEVGGAIFVHSANPSGAQRLMLALQHAENRPEHVLVARTQYMG